MFDQINIETLILKYLQGELTEGEQRELDEWLKDDRNKKLFSRLINKQRILLKIFQMFPMAAMMRMVLIMDNVSVKIIF